MVHFRFRLPRQAALALGAACAIGASAQTAVAPPAAGMADKTALATKVSPLDAQAAVPPLRYTPAFAGYKGVLNQPVGNWKDANDLTAQIGGWRAYAKQAREPESAPMPAMTESKPGMAAPAVPAASMPSGHGNHKSR